MAYIYFMAINIKVDLSNTTRVNHSMYAYGRTSMTVAHITKEVAQATIDEGVITPEIYAKTLCSKTLTFGTAWDMSGGVIRVCKACQKKAGA